jgi:hypothetical protein
VSEADRTASGYSCQCWKRELADEEGVRLGALGDDVLREEYGCFVGVDEMHAALGIEAQVCVSGMRFASVTELFG